MPFHIYLRITVFTIYAKLQYIFTGCLANKRLGTQHIRYSRPYFPFLYGLILDFASHASLEHHVNALIFFWGLMIKLKMTKAMNCKIYYLGKP